MSIAEFIQQQLGPIVGEWSEQAVPHGPHGPGEPAPRPERACRLAQDMLLAVAAEIRAGRDEAASSPASSDDPPPDRRVARAHAARRYAQDRFEAGCTLQQMVAEFCALHASVPRRWLALGEAAGPEQLRDCARFGESMERALADAIAGFAERQEFSRNVLLAVLGHDLRNPLGTILNAAQYLRRRGGLDGAQTQAVDRVLAGGMRLHGLVDDLLDASKTRLGTQLPFERRPADVGEICRRTLDELEGLHPECTLALRCEGETVAEVDPRRIEQLVSNIVSNAFIHGDRDRRIDVSVRGEVAAVTIRVHNEGPVIDPAVRRRMSAPPAPAVVPEKDRRDGASGLGLGLYIARQIAVAHGGRIDIVSERGAGTSLDVRLPRASGAASSSARNLGPAQASRTARGWPASQPG